MLARRVPGDTGALNHNGTTVDYDHGAAEPDHDRTTHNVATSGFDHHLHGIAGDYQHNDARYNNHHHNGGASTINHDDHHRNNYDDRRTGSFRAGRGVAL